MVSAGKTTPLLSRALENQLDGGIVHDMDLSILAVPDLARNSANGQAELPSIVAQLVKRSLHQGRIDARDQHLEFPLGRRSGGLSADADA